MIPLERLLAPVSVDLPAGPDASSSGLLLELEALIQGKPETQFSAAEEPNWHTAAARCLEAAATTRDLRVAAIVAAVLLRTRGLPGLHAGLQLVRGYLEQYWSTVHPLLDATDNNDPQERINALNNLAAPVGTDGDLLRVIQVLRETPLVESPQTGRFSLAAWLAVKGLAPWPESNGEMPTLAVLEGTRDDSDAEKVSASLAAAEGCLRELTAITKLFEDHAGSANTPTLEPLRKDLQQVVAWIGKPDATGESADGGAAGAARPANAAYSGEIRSREDVLRALEAIILYYKTHEPSSPVPFLLQRVKRVVPMNFVDLIRDLSPESLDRLMILTGPLDEAAAS